MSGLLKSILRDFRKCQMMRIYQIQSDMVKNSNALTRSMEDHKTNYVHQKKKKSKIKGGGNDKKRN